MGTEDLTRPFVDQRFVAIHPLSESAGGKPIGGVLRLHFELQSLLLRLALLQAHGGDRRHRESYAGHPSIIWLMTISLQNVGSDDLSIVAGYRRQGRPHACGVAGGIDSSIGYALEIFIQFQAAFADGDVPRR